MTDIDVRWAWSQVEAAADGSLSPDEERRMRAAMTSDPELRGAVRRATRLRTELRGLGSDRVPRGLALRLLRIPRGDAAGGSALWSWASAAGTAFAVALTLHLITQPGDVPAYDERAAALEEFEIAMTYLRRSYAMAGEQAVRVMERELLDSVRRGRGGADDGNGREGNGG